MDGRDIGTHVLPDAEVKIFLTASVDVRAKRRFEEIKDKTDITLQQLEAEIAQRDRMDEQREASPLICAPDAVRTDTTNMTITEVVEQILKIARAKLNGDA